jgi:hypothetical protein
MGNSSNRLLLSELLNLPNGIRQDPSARPEAEVARQEVASDPADQRREVVLDGKDEDDTVVREVEKTPDRLADEDAQPQSPRLRSDGA